MTWLRVRFVAWVVSWMVGPTDAGAPVSHSKPVFAAVGIAGLFAFAAVFFFVRYARAAKRPAKAAVPWHALGWLSCVVLSALPALALLLVAISLVLDGPH